MKANLLRRVLLAKAMVFVGLALMVAVVLGAASTAQAHTGFGGLFHLNHSNTVNAISQLVGFVAGPVLRIDNNSSSTDATALDLQVEPGKPPMTVNSSARVANLNADRLDNKDASAFLSSTNYSAVSTEGPGAGTGAVRRLEVHCRAGDLPLGGGIANVDPGTVVLSSFPELRFTPPGWVVSVQHDNTLDNDLVAVVLCADQ
jgi:hypothetical protein